MSDSHQDLFGRPTLIAGEDSERFKQLSETIFEYVKPTNVFEAMLADDVINKRWEEERLQRCGGRAIETSFRAALKNHLREIGLGDADASEMTKRYFAGSPKKQAVIVALLAKHGITPEHVWATAMQYKLDPLQVMDNMRGNRESARRLLQKEIKKLLRARQRAEVFDRDSKALHDGD